MSKMKTIFVAIFTLFSISIFLVINFKKSEANIVLLSTNKSLINIGKKIYLKNCASCHGINLEGQINWMSRLPNGLMPAPPHNENGHTWHHSDKYLFMITKYGIEEFIGENYPNNMPAYKNILNDTEIIAVLSYIKSTWPQKIREIHDKINLRGKHN